MDIIKEVFEKIPYIGIPSIGIRDIIDVIVVAYLIYVVLIWIKDTRTWALFKGVIIVLAVAIIAYTFQLHTLSWVISNTITVGTFAILVVFQPELRRALEQIGRGKFFDSLITPMSNNEEGITDETIEALAKACVHMGKNKTGALIAIEERTGIKIDAVPSSQLLINIFEKNTPLHDGAVVVKNNRISAATCFLPLSDSMEISKDLGTRHRAAIGLSEITDAIVLVVSEETGTISCVRNGKLKRDLDIDLIRKILASTRRKKRTERKKVKWKGKIENE